MKRIGLFVDVSNLFYCLSKKYPGEKLDYTLYYEYVEELGDIKQAVAYGTQINNEAEKFIACLQIIGFLPKYKKIKVITDASGRSIKKRADWNVGITIDILEMFDHLDMVILGSSNADLEPLIQLLRSKGIDVVVFACGISNDIVNAATKCIEIPKSLLETEQTSYSGEAEAEVNDAKD